MSTRDPNRDLSKLLREADPMAHESGLAAEQAAELRRTILTRATEKAPGLWPQLLPALSAAALLILALGTAWWPAATFQAGSSSPAQSEVLLPIASPDPGSAAVETEVATENRKIQFETPGGTLVVWVLNPNFPS